MHLEVNELPECTLAQHVTIDKWLHVSTAIEPQVTIDVQTVYSLTTVPRNKIWYNTTICSEFEVVSVSVIDTRLISTN